MLSTDGSNAFAELFRANTLLNLADYVVLVADHPPETQSDPISNRYQALQRLFEPHLSNSQIDKAAVNAQILKIAEEGTAIKVEPVSTENGEEVDVWKEISSLPQRMHSTDSYTSLIQIVLSYREELRERIAMIPNSLDKARDMLRGLVVAALENPKTFEPHQVYDAMVFISGEITKNVVAEVLRRWARDYVYHQHYAQGIGPFWSPRTGEESLDTISHYRFRECFGVSEFSECFDIAQFSQVFEEAEEELERAILEATESPVIVFGSRESFDAAMVLWQISRSHSLSARLEDAIYAALRRLSKGSVPESWSHYYRPLEETGPETDKYVLENSTFQTPSTTVIALACLALFKLDTQGQFRTTAISAARWLIEHQNTDGSWRTEAYTDPGEHLAVRNDLLTTLLSIEILLRSGLPDTKRAIQSGWNWILAHQNDLGAWDSELTGEKREWLPYPLNTVLTLELAYLLENPPTLEPSAYVAYSRDDWKEFAEPLVNHLKEAGISVWVDQHILRTGQIWLDEINKALKQYSYMVLCVSPSAMNSRWVKKEYRYFLDKEKPIFPVICKPTDMPAELRDIQHSDYGEFDTLIDDIRHTHNERSKSVKP